MRPAVVIPERITPVKVLIAGPCMSRCTVLARKEGGDDDQDPLLPDVFVLKVSDMYQRRPGREIQILSRLQKTTDHVPKLYGFFRGFFSKHTNSRTQTERWAFNESDTFVTFIMEFAPMGDVMDLLPALKSAEERVRTASCMARHILDAIIDLHQRIGAVHGDIKLENILVSSRERYMLTDFETARYIGEYDVVAEQTQRSTIIVGTGFMTPPEIVCPEIVARPDLRSKLLPAADIYGLGVAVFEVITGHTFASYLRGAASRKLSNRADCEQLDDLRAVMRDSFHSMEHEFIFSKLFDRYIQDDLARDFIRICTSAQPDRRPTARQLLNHSFLRDDRGDDMC